MQGNPNPSPSTRFKPGNNANPGGKPKGRTLAFYLREGLESVGKDGKTRAQAIAEKLLDMCDEGDRQAIKDVFDRIDGKVPDKLVTEQIDVTKCTEEELEDIIRTESKG